ncbi:hypothetical protein YC2023_024760 [Brassica napus]
MAQRQIERHDDPSQITLPKTPLLEITQMSTNRMTPLEHLRTSSSRKKLDGLMPNEVQGDMCGEVLRQADCGAQGARSCGALCGYLERGTVHCVRVSDGKLACFCIKSNKGSSMDGNYPSVND